MMDDLTFRFITVSGVLGWVGSCCEWWPRYYQVWHCHTCWNENLDDNLKLRRLLL